MELIVVRGDTPSFTLTCTDAAGVVVDLTGAAISFTVKRTFSDPIENALIRKSVGSGIIATDLDGGIVTLQFVAEDTADIPVVQTYRDQYWSAPMYWDLQLVDGAGSVFTLDSGTLLVQGDVTTPVSEEFSVTAGDSGVLTDLGHI